MKKIFTFLIVVLLVSITKAQVKDSVKMITDAEISKGIDLSVVIIKMKILRFDKNNRPISNEIYKTNDSIKKNRYVSINIKLLDSLLKPYYFTTNDSQYYDTIKDIRKIRPRYRRVVNAYTLDTTYVPLPKYIGNIAVKKTVGIDTLKIVKAVVIDSINRTKKAKAPVWWKAKNSIGFDINEIAFINWNAGGSNSIAGLLKVYFERDYDKIYTLWQNKISVRYGLNEQEGKGLIKTDDEIKLSSSFGYRKDSVSNWYYSAKFNFNTQFTNGYKYPNTDDPISRFFAPAYIFLGLGAQYNLTESNFNLYLSPLTLKSTLVFDEQLSNDGAFGVDKGNRSRNEFGALVQGSWVVEIVKNVAVTNQLSLYSDYINKFGNIDVDWVLKFQFKINNFLEANFRTHLIYDDDITFETGIDPDGNPFSYGARVQFKQQLGIGILYRF